MNEGTITGVRLDRGFGFIAVSGERDVFFHYKQLADELPFDEKLQERRVRFDVENSPKGPRAVNVRPVFWLCLPWPRWQPAAGDAGVGDAGARHRGDRNEGSLGSHPLRGVDIGRAGTASTRTRGNGATEGRRRGPPASVAPRCDRAPRTPARRSALWSRLPSCDSALH